MAYNNFLGKRSNNDITNDIQFKSARKDDLAKLWIQFLNLPLDCNWQMLKDLVKLHCDCEDCYVDVILDYDGQHTGNGVVALKTNEQVEKLINNLNNYNLNGNNIIVRRETKENKFSKNFEVSKDPNAGILLELGVEPGPISSQVFVANVDYETSIGDLELMFRLAGGVQHIEKIDSEAKGCYLIRFDHPLEAIQAIAMFNHQRYKGRNLAVKMDRVKSISKKQVSFSILPPGLQSIGFGLGISGQPLNHVAQFANGLALQNLPVFGEGSARNESRKMQAPSLPPNFNIPSNPGFSRNVNVNPYFPSQMNMKKAAPQLDFAAIVNETVRAVTNHMMNSQLNNPMMEYDYTKNVDYMTEAPVFEKTQPKLQPYFNQINDKCTITVSNLPNTMSWQMLKDKCKEIGDVKFVEVNTIGAKNIGTVLFKTHEDANKAIERLWYQTRTFSLLFLNILLDNLFFAYTHKFIYACMPS